MKGSALPWILLICVGACSYTPAGSGTPQLRPGMTEDQIFDVTHQPPVALLRQLYEDHQLLVLSMEQDDYQGPYRALAALLAQIGHDPRLKYIVMEHPAEIAPVLEAASVANLDEIQLLQQLRQQLAIRDKPDTGFVSAAFVSRMALCHSDMAIFWGEMLPHIRTVNASRPAAHKLLATGVDGGLTVMRAGTGKGTVNYERDSTTAMVFHNKIWRELQRDPNAKAILIFNIGHTIQGSTAMRQTRTVATSFLSIFLRDHPEAKPRTALVLVEGGLTADDGSDGYVFKFTQRQVARAPDRSFGVRTVPFRGVVTEQGDSAFTAAAEAGRPSVSQRGTLPSQSTPSLAEMVDAIVWLPQSERQHITKKGSAYFPKACGEP